MLPQVPRPNKREVVSSYWLWQWKNFCCHLYRSYVTIQGCTEKVQSKRKVFLKKDNYQGSETEEMGWLNNSETESLSLSATINNLRTTVLFWPKSIKVGQVGSSGLNIGWTVAFTSPSVHWDNNQSFQQCRVNLKECWTVCFPRSKAISSLED